MSRWMRKVGQNSMLFEQQEESGMSGIGDSEEEETNQSGIQNNSQEDQTLTEGQSPFSDPSLAGRFKTEADLAEFLAVQDSAVKSLRTRTQTLEQEMSRPREILREEPEEEITAQDFFADPTKNIQKIVAKTIEAQLKSTVAPLLQDVARNRNKESWDTVKNRYDNFETYREATEEKLRAWGVPTENQNPELIEQAFLAEVGAAAVSGNFRPHQGREHNPTAPAINPQHRPSAHPIKPDGGGRKDKIKLTEEERRLARVQFRGSENPEEDYVKWAGFDEADDDAYMLEEK